MMDAATAGFFIGGGLGAVIAYVAARKRAGEAEPDDRGAVNLARYRHVYADGALRTALTAPVALFATLNRRETLGFLQNFEDVAAAYARCRAGDASPTLMAGALTARRLAANRLAVLVRRARQERPSPASDLAEDFEALKKFLADYLYNIGQEQGLQRLHA